MILALRVPHIDPANQEPAPIFTQYSSLPGIPLLPDTTHNGTANCVVLCPETKQSTTHEQHSGGGGG